MNHKECLPLYIDGAFIYGESQFPNINPLNGQVITHVTKASKGDVHQAVLAAKNALKGEWGGYQPLQISAYLHKIADGIEARFEDFVQAEVGDTGRPEKLARTLDVPRAIANFRTFADMAKNRISESSETALAEGGTLLNYTVRKPLGVIAVISPWNLPILLLTWKLAPALAAGNAVVCKPSEESPSSATLLAEVIDAVGLPKGVFNLVHGYGSQSTGEYLTMDPDISAITFTGASSTGRHIMQVAAKEVKDISFELGGKNAAVVFADADFDKAIEGIMRSAFFNTGQVCLCTERVYVERPIYDQFVKALKARVENLVLGYPNDEATDLGPLISQGHLDKVRGYMALAKTEGATFVIGGQSPTFNDARDSGFFMAPTILTGLDDHSRTMQEEIFGPVCHVAPFDDEKEVLARVNNSVYGLAATIWTENVSRAHRVAKQISVGIVWINTWYARDLRTPFGGAKHSGIGREGGYYALDFYSEITNISLRYE